MPTINPADGEAIGEYCIAGIQEIDQAVSSAKDAFENEEWSKSKPSYRSKLLWKVGELIEEHADEFDDLYDKLVKLRHEIATTLGYNNFVELGYLRMGRSDYGPDEVANFIGGV